MQYFWHWAIKPLFTHCNVQSTMEIGSRDGGMISRLAAAFPEMKLNVLDPCYDYDLESKFKDFDMVTVHKGTSLEVLPAIKEKFDVIFIDGDHNYYTVNNELRLIEEGQLLNPGGMLIFHDIQGPWAREDYYYKPEVIPDEARAESAKHGVFTAVEEFTREVKPDWVWFSWNAQHGLGCLSDPSAGLGEASFKMKKMLWLRYRWKKRILRALGLWKDKP